MANAQQPSEKTFGSGAQQRWLERCDGIDSEGAVVAWQRACSIG